MPTATVKIRECDTCGEVYEYKRASSKYCSDLCRYNAQFAVSGRVRVPDSVRFAVLQRDGFACRYCGSRPPYQELQVDHVVSVSSGGRLLELDNLITACARCNNGKGSQSVEAPDPVVGVFWNLTSFPPEEWVDCTRIRLTQAEDTTYYDIEAE